MKKDEVSRTAQYMALFRALETARPSHDRLFNDPYAIHFLDARLKFFSKLSSISSFRSLIQRYIQKKVPGAFSSGLARTKYIDDQLQQSIKAGVRQLVILGAGFDMRAQRLDFMELIPTIEIDHPNTSSYKLNLLRNKFGALSDKIMYCQIDFNTQSLEDLAQKYSIDFSVPSTIIWEGVTNYLSSDAVEKTFSWISRFAKGSHVIFTYVHQDILDYPEKFFGGERLLNDLREIEETWTFGLIPENVPAFLGKFSLNLLADLGANEYRNKYLPDRSETGYEFYRVAVARR